MSEFDVNLISAFAKCPAFYDKSNPNFKDRTYTENAWKEISLQLGFDEKVLRDRMFQLRNRYNLEKRKVEMQDGDPNAKSTWPLFDRMSFLEGHIRPRKSYKSIMNRSMEGNEHQHSQFANNGMFFNHRSNSQMRQYPQHHFAVQNAHNARLQQLANHIQMMANNNDDPTIDLNGDSFPGISNNLALELSLLEGDDRNNPLQLFQQQQLTSQQHRQQFLRRDAGGPGENNSEIKAEYYSESDEDEDGLRDTETDTTSKSKDDMASFTQRMTEASSSSQALGDLLNSVDDVDGSASARNDNASRNGTVSEPGQSTATDVDEAFLNPMDILMNRQSTGSMQINHSSSSGNVRYTEPQKRKSDTGLQNNLEGRSSSYLQAGPSPPFKRRRRNYQNMIPNVMVTNSGSGGLRSSQMMGGNKHQIPSTSALQGSNAVLANQTMLLNQLQNTLANQQTFLQQPSPVTMMGYNNSAHHTPPLPDKYAAFGQFMASSLSELNGVKALDLIGKFTVEVVNALREQKEQAAALAVPEPENHHNSSDLSANTASNLHSNIIGDDKYTQQF